MEFIDVVENKEIVKLSKDKKDYISSQDIYDTWNFENNYIIFMNEYDKDILSFDIFLVVRKTSETTFVCNVPNEYIKYFEGRGYILKDFYNNYIINKLSKFNS